MSPNLREQTDGLNGSPVSPYRPRVALCLAFSGDAEDDLPAMADLGRALALMHAAHRSFRTLRASAHHWYDPGVAYAAFHQAQAMGLPAFSVLGDRSEGTAEAVSRLWVELPARLRAEQEGKLPGQEPGPYVKVVDGQRWWHYSPRWGARYGEGPEGSFTDTHFEELLDPRRLLASMRHVSCGGPAVVAGRQGIVLRWRGWGGQQLIDTEAVVDAERGILLRAVDRFDGRDLQARQLASLTFGEAHPGEVFTFVPPEGEELLPVPDDQEVTIEEAAALANFTVYVPAQLPGGMPAQVFYWPGWQRRGLPDAELRLQILGPGQAVIIRQWAGLRCAHEELDWRHVRHDGQDLLVASAPEWGTQIQLRKGDTGIEVWAPLAHPQPPEGPSTDEQEDRMGPSTDPDAAIALAASLVPVAPAARPLRELAPQAPAGPATHDLAGPFKAPAPAYVEPGPPAIDSELCTLFECIFSSQARFRSLQASVKSWNSSADTTSVTELFVQTPSGAASPVSEDVAYGPHPPATLTEIGPLIAWMDIEVNGHTTVAPRRGLRLTVRLGPPPIRFPAWGSSRECLLADGHLQALVSEAVDEWELVVDLAFGVLLRGQAHAAGKTVASVETGRCDFDTGA